MAGVLLTVATAAFARQAVQPQQPESAKITNETVIYLLDRFPPSQVAQIIGTSKSPVDFQLDQSTIALLIARGADSTVLQAMFNAMMKSHGQLTNQAPAPAPVAALISKPVPTRVPKTIVLNDLTEAKVRPVILEKNKLSGKILLNVETEDANPPLITHSDKYDLYFYNVNKILFDYKFTDQSVTTAPVGGDLAELKDALSALTSAFQTSTSTTAANSKAAANVKPAGRAEESVKCFDLSAALAAVTSAVQNVQADLSGPAFNPQDSSGKCHHVPYELTKRAWESAKSHYGTKNDCSGSSSVQCAMQTLMQQLEQNQKILCPGTDVSTAYEAYNQLHDRLQQLANRFGEIQTIVLPDSEMPVPYLVQHQFIDINSTGTMQLHELNCALNAGTRSLDPTKPQAKPAQNTPVKVGDTQQTTVTPTAGDASASKQGDSGEASKPSPIVKSVGGTSDVVVYSKLPGSNPSQTVDTDISPLTYKLTSGRDALSASAGLLLTTLQSRSYTFASVPSGNGRVLQVDGTGSFRPALSALLNYDIPYLPNYKDIGLAVSAGLVLDLANGKADTSNFGFFVGPSVHLFHRFFVSPGWHFGQFADYPSGFGQNPSQVVTNASLGSPVAVKRYTGRFAISITFQVPTPSANKKSTVSDANMNPKTNSASQSGGKANSPTGQNP